jgi:aminoglycoside phosphotransferase (APT) family kinase protein
MRVRRGRQATRFPVNEDLPGLPVRAIDTWLREALPELMHGGRWHAEVISGGLSNITYRLRLPGGSVILRRPPLGDLLPSAHNMQREFRVLGALAPTTVPVPRPLASCTAGDVLDSDFYVMTDVPGEVLRRPQDSAGLTPELRGELADALVATLADLHSIDPDEVGLGDYGRPAGYCARQIRRWGDQWQRSRTRDLPDMDMLLGRLAMATPSDGSRAIVHGDYRLDNTLIDPATARITAVLDWELSTLGDPLADLAMMLTYWHDRDDDERGSIPVAAGLTVHDGFPCARQLADCYGALTSRDLSRLPFYLALSSMKLAVILEGVHARYLGGRTVGEGYESAGDAVPLLVARALRQLRGSRP